MLIDIDRSILEINKQNEDGSILYRFGTDKGLNTKKPIKRVKKKRTNMNYQSMNQEDTKRSAEPNQISTTLLADLSNPILPNMDEKETKGDANQQPHSPSQFKKQFEE